MVLWLTHEQARAIADHARAAYPNEACGLISGSDGRVTHITPIDNVAATPQTHFEMHPQQQIAEMKRIIKAGEDLIAIYHSHPKTDPVPSQTDVHYAAYPEAITLIVSLQRATPRFQAWYLRHEACNPVTVHIGATPPPPDRNAPLSPTQKTAIILAAIIAGIVFIMSAIALLPPAPPIPGR